jgi:2-oxoglutarate dehydrogenase E2 component (dihydrolipoamide succinyltransferase)
MSTQVIMPQLGESVVEGTVSRWLKQVGDPVEAFEPLLEVSTDKVETEIPSPGSGVLLAVYVEAGQTVAKGTLLALIGAEDEQPVSAAAPVQEPAAVGAATTNDWHVTPVVARMAAEHQLDLNRIEGSGRGGRVTKKDVEAYLSARRDEPSLAPWETPGSGDLFKPTDAPPKAQAAAPAPAVKPASPPASDAPDGELVALTPMRRAIAEHMVHSKLHTAPHVTTVFEVDLSAVLAHREANKTLYSDRGVHLTLTAYFAAAAIEALRAQPYLNAEWREDGIFLHRRIHLGVAVALDSGLIVPVIRDAQDMNLLGLARAINDLAARARGRQLAADATRGGTFTISNHGVSGSLFATPIIHQPQVGILGVGMMEQRVKVIDGMIAVRPCVYVSLTFDHRVADGATGDAFMTTLKRTLEGWRE